MEVSSSIKPPLRLPPPRNRRLSGSSLTASASPLQQFPVRRGLSVRCSPSHGAITSNLLSCSQSSLCSNTGKNIFASWRHSPRKDFHQQGPDQEMYRRDRSARKTVVRSELVGSGMADAARPTPEVKITSRVRGILFYVVTSIAAIFLIVPMLLQHPMVLLMDRYRRKAHYFIAKLWATIAITPFLKVEFEGLENLPTADTPAVYVSNHQSFLDIYTLLTLGRSFKFISKTSIFRYPIIGWAMSMLGVIPLKRMDSRSQVVRDSGLASFGRETVVISGYLFLLSNKLLISDHNSGLFEAVHRACQERVLCVFLSRRNTKQGWEIRCIQGMQLLVWTRWLKKQLVLSLHAYHFWNRKPNILNTRLNQKGAFSIATKTGAPVVPLALVGTGSIMPTGMESILNMGSVKVVVLKPIEGSNPEVLCSEARKAIADVLDKQV